MQTQNKQTLPIVVVIMTGLMLSCWFGQAWANEDMQVYLWVANEMEIESVPPIPQIHFVEKNRLQTEFKNGNRRSYLRWEAEYGEAQARRILSEYLEGVVGLFDPKSETIYVEVYLSPCRRRAILAHEICHFFQHLTKGVVSPGQYGADLEHLVREMEAYKIEKKFNQIHCTIPAP